MDRLLRRDDHRALANFEQPRPRQLRGAQPVKGRHIAVAGQTATKKIPAVAPAPAMRALDERVGTLRLVEDIGEKKKGLELFGRIHIDVETPRLRTDGPIFLQHGRVEDDPGAEGALQQIGDALVGAEGADLLL